MRTSRALDLGHLHFVAEQPAVRDRIQRAMGEHLFTQYALIPQAYTSWEVVINPSVVGEYVFPGNFSIGFTNLEFVVPAG